MAVVTPFFSNFVARNFVAVVTLMYIARNSVAMEML